MSDPASLARRAAELAQRGEDAAAAALFAEALARFPHDPRLANSAGNFHARAGRNPEALALFEQALALAPTLAEAGINAAIVLLRLNRPHDARQVLGGRLAAPPDSAQYWALRGDAERLCGARDEAAQSYAKAAARDPRHRRALAGRARLSLERGEPRAVDDYAAALATTPGDPQLFHDYTLALADAGDVAAACSHAEALVRQLPGWVQGQVLLAELRWASGDPDRFDAALAAAATEHPTPELYQAWAAVLAGVDQHGRAAEVLAAARAHWPEDPALALNCAIAAGEAGDADAARALFDAFAGQTCPDWQVARARNLLQAGDPDAAQALLAALAETGQGGVSAWALLDLCWRLQDDPRHTWLHGQDGLVRKLPLPLNSGELAEVIACLTTLHQRSLMPLGQSIKQGSQTRGELFARREPPLARLREALHAVLDTYRAGLPAADPRHPLLAQRGAGWAITSSWSIRMAGRGLHASHIHPRGLLSSACYFVLPEATAADPQAGWLELGRPPQHLAAGLGPLQVIAPAVGHCVLFPSTLFHGTRPIAGGTRMTVAFDVTVTG